MKALSVNCVTVRCRQSYECRKKSVRTFRLNGNYMKAYTKIYLNTFQFCSTDFIPCEICGCQAVDIHHIQARSKRKDLENDITNLMALCRKDHLEYGDKKQHMDYLQQVHNQKLDEARRI